MLQNIRLLSNEKLEKVLTELDLNSKLVKKIYTLLWHQFATSFDDFEAIIPHKQLQILKNKYFIPQTSVKKSFQSVDNTIKCIINLYDDNIIESVLIPEHNRVTICVSSQVGCSLDCTFCATGRLKMKRNLGYDEIVDQVVLLNKISVQRFNIPITNIVFMGMGEPLLNYKNVIQSIKIFTDQKGLSIAPRRITISTAGIVKAINTLAKDKVKVQLAISLHAVNDTLRSNIMPINNTNNIKSLSEAIINFYNTTKVKITIEYVILKDVNDSILDAIELVRLTQKLPVKVVNVIEYNTFDSSIFSKSEKSNTDLFVQHLHKHKINAYLRRSRGNDIAAACGQLAQQT